MDFRILLLLTLTALSLPAHALKGGVIDDNRPDSPWAGVGSLSIEGGGTFSGAIISPRHVLTAAHVVSSLQNSPDSITFNLNLADDRMQSFEVAAVHVYPGYKGVRIGPDGVWYHDLAVVELREAVPASVPIYDLFDGTIGSEPASRELTFVSYGNAVEPNIAGLIQGNPRVKRVGRNEVESLFWSRDDTSGPGVFVFEFDPGSLRSALPDGSSSSFSALSGPREAAYIGGDSGSPVFVQVDGTWKLAGVAAFAASSPGADALSFTQASIGGGTLVAPHLDWLRQQLASPPTQPTGYMHWLLPGTVLVVLVGLIVYFVPIRSRQVATQHPSDRVS